jgi:hypothetical protein
MLRLNLTSQATFARRLDLSGAYTAPVQAAAAPVSRALTSSKSADVRAILARPAGFARFF